MKKIIAGSLAFFLGFGMGTVAPAWAEVFHRFTDKSNIEKGRVSDDSGNPRLENLELEAGQLATGTVPDARLSSNVPLKDTENVMTSTNTFRAPDSGAAAIVLENSSQVVIGSMTNAGKFVAVSFEGDGSGLTGVTGASHGDGTNCSANQFLKGVDGTGNAQSCATLLDADVPNTITIDLAATASALAANGANCSANQFNKGVDASGAAEACAALVDADVPNTITIDLADTATALAANGANCSAGNSPLGVDASGAVEGCFDVTTESELTTHIGVTDAHFDHADSLAELNSQIGSGLVTGAHTTTLAASAITAGTFPSGTFTYQGTVILNGIEVRGLDTEANICAATCTGHGASKVCQFVSSTSFDIYNSTGTGASQTGQYRNTRTGVGPC